MVRKKKEIVIGKVLGLKDFNKSQKLKACLQLKSKPVVVLNFSEIEDFVRALEMSEDSRSSNSFESSSEEQNASSESNSRLLRSSSNDETSKISDPLENIELQPLENNQNKFDWGQYLEYEPLAHDDNDPVWKRIKNSEVERKEFPSKKYKEALSIHNPNEMNTDVQSMAEVAEQPISPRSELIKKRLGWSQSMHKYAKNQGSENDQSQQNSNKTPLNDNVFKFPQPVRKSNEYPQKKTFKRTHKFRQPRADIIQQNVRSDSRPPQNRGWVLEKIVPLSPKKKLPHIPAQSSLAGWDRHIHGLHSGPQQVPYTPEIRLPKIKNCVHSNIKGWEDKRVQLPLEDAVVPQDVRFLEDNILKNQVVPNEESTKQNGTTTLIEIASYDPNTPEKNGTTTPIEIASPDPPDVNTHEKNATLTPIEIASPDPPDLNTPEKNGTTTPIEIASPDPPDVNTHEKIATLTPIEIASPDPPDLDTREKNVILTPIEIASPDPSDLNTPEKNATLTLIEIASPDPCDQNTGNFVNSLQSCESSTESEVLITSSPPQYQNSLREIHSLSDFRVSLKITAESILAQRLPTTGESDIAENLQNTDGPSIVESLQIMGDSDTAEIFQIDSESQNKNLQEQESNSAENNRVTKMKKVKRRIFGRYVLNTKRRRKSKVQQERIRTDTDLRPLSDETKLIVMDELISELTPKRASRRRTSLKTTPTVEANNTEIRYITRSVAKAKLKAQNQPDENDNSIIREENSQHVESTTKIIDSSSIIVENLFPVEEKMTASIEENVVEENMNASIEVNVVEENMNASIQENVKQVDSSTEIVKNLIVNEKDTNTLIVSKDQSKPNDKIKRIVRRPPKKTSIQDNERKDSESSSSSNEKLLSLSKDSKNSRIKEKKKETTRRCIENQSSTTKYESYSSFKDKLTARSTLNVEGRELRSPDVREIIPESPESCDTRMADYDFSNSLCETRKEKKNYSFAELFSQVETTYNKQMSLKSMTRPRMKKNRFDFQKIENRMILSTGVFLTSQFKVLFTYNFRSIAENSKISTNTKNVFFNHDGEEIDKFSVTPLWIENLRKVVFHEKKKLMQFKMDKSAELFMKMVCESLLTTGVCDDYRCRKNHEMRVNFSLSADSIWQASYYILSRSSNPYFEFYASVLNWLGEKKSLGKIFVLAEIFYKLNEPNSLEKLQLWEHVVKGIVKCGMSDWEAMLSLIFYFYNHENPKMSWNFMEKCLKVHKRSIEMFWKIHLNLAFLGFVLKRSSILILVEIYCISSTMHSQEYSFLLANQVQTLDLPTIEKNLFTLKKLDKILKNCLRKISFLEDESPTFERIRSIEDVGRLLEKTFPSKVLPNLLLRFLNKKSVRFMRNLRRFLKRNKMKKGIEAIGSICLSLLARFQKSCKRKRASKMFKLVHKKFKTHNLTPLIDEAK